MFADFGIFSRMNFADQLQQAVLSKGNSLCVGLDPRLKNLPAELKNRVDPGTSQSIAEAYESFCRAIIDVVAPLVPIVKPQSAFFESIGPAGVQALANVVRYAREKNVLVLMDAKRGDIGSTAQAYAEAYLGERNDHLVSDALTVNPYMGVDTLDPFVASATANRKGIFVLVKTSNPGSGHFQDQTVEGRGERLFEMVADEVEKLSAAHVGDCGYGPVGAVVGATYPEQLETLRRRMPHVILLIPGFGAQGGGVEDVREGFDKQGTGAIVNSSRGIIFAYEKEQHAGIAWQDAIAAECRQAAESLSVKALSS